MVQVLADFTDNKFAGNFCKEGLSAGAGLLLLVGELIDHAMECLKLAAE